MAKNREFSRREEENIKKEMADIKSKVMQEAAKAKEVINGDIHSIQNEAPQLWQNFEQFWNACIKNGEDRHKVACKIHLQSLGWLDKPEKWIEGVIHFGIKVEK